MFLSTLCSNIDPYSLMHINIDFFLVSILKSPRQLWDAWSHHRIRLCISLLFPLCRAVRCDWPPFFSVCTGGWRQVLSAAECCCVCGLQRPSPTFQQYFDGHRYSRETEETDFICILQQKSWEGEWEPAVIYMYLQWEDLDIKLCISFLLLSCNSSLNNTALPDFKQRFRRLSLSFQTGLISTSTSSFHSHPAWKNKKRWCLCTRDAKRAHAVVKMEAKRKCRGGGGRKLTIFGISR